MPITKGAGNPVWNRDETLLALDLLYRHGTPIHKGHPDVDELSALLRNAQIHPMDDRRPSFRNADGVALKLQNLFSAINPDRGLSSSSLDRALVHEFPVSRANELATLTQMIREAIAQGEVAERLSDEETFMEGRLLTSKHRSRDQRLRKMLLAKLGKTSLTCSLCDFQAPRLPRDLQESFFEAHHIRPLSEWRGEKSTGVTDLALLCASCHRFIHKLIAVRKQWVSIDEARSAIFDTDTA